MYWRVLAARQRATFLVGPTVIVVDLTPQALRKQDRLADFSSIMHNERERTHDILT